MCVSRGFRPALKNTPARPPAADLSLSLYLCEHVLSTHMLPARSQYGKGTFICHPDPPRPSSTAAPKGCGSPPSSGGPSAACSAGSAPCSSGCRRPAVAPPPSSARALNSGSSEREVGRAAAAGRQQGRSKKMPTASTHALRSAEWRAERRAEMGRDVEMCRDAETCRDAPRYGSRAPAWPPRRARAATRATSPAGRRPG